jgi:hypothetical protein
MTRRLYASSMTILRDLCKAPLFAQFLRQTQILILKILNVFLRLKLSPSLNLNKNEHFSKVSLRMSLTRNRPNSARFDHKCN